MATDFDFQLDTLKFHLLRDAPEPSYSQRWVRQEVQSQQPIAGAQFVQSRDDIVFMHQTDWAGGTTWWLPIISATEPNSFYHAWGCDTWSRPGAVQPAAPVTSFTMPGHIGKSARVGNVTYVLAWDNPAGQAPASLWGFTDGGPAWVDTTVNSTGATDAALQTIWSVCNYGGNPWWLIKNGEIEDGSTYFFLAVGFGLSEPT